MSDSLVIVAIPAEDDYVMKVSSEKIPHLTLLYLGEAGSADLEQIIGFVEHASTLIQPFYMDVEYRGTLGEDEADVIFFEKGWDYKMVNGYREQLKQHPAIKMAYASADQYPEWRPHLTLGYPETPANEPDEERKLYSVHFDRIAVWDGDFKGMEFRLKQKVCDRDLAMADVRADESALQHYGVKGMRWGVRTTDLSRQVARPGQAIQGAKAAKYERTQSIRERKFQTQDTQVRVQIGKKGERKIETRGGKGMEPAPEAVKARVLVQQKKASGLQTLSNQELRDLATRLQLEKQVRDLTSTPASQSKAVKFVKTALLNQNDRQKNINNYADLDGLLGGGKLPLAAKAVKAATKKK